MNEIVNKFLLAGDKFTSEMHLRQPALLDESGYTLYIHTVFVEYLQKTKKESKNLKKQEIYSIFIKAN